jgi:RecD/TraA family predicted helicase
MFVAVSGSVLRVERKTDSFCRMVVLGDLISEAKIETEDGQPVLPGAGIVVLGEKLEALRPKDKVILIGDHQIHKKFGPQVRLLKWWLTDRCPFKDPADAVENYRHLVEDLKLTPKLSEKIFSRYLCDTKTTLSTNPYILVQHGVERITVKTIDEKIAPYYGISKKDMRRLNAAILDTVKTARTNGIPLFESDDGTSYGNRGPGHSYVDFTQLVCHVADESEVPRKIVREAVLQIASTPRNEKYDPRPNLVIEKDDSGSPRYVYEWSIHRHEQGLGLHLRRLLEETTNPRLVALADDIALPETFTLTGEQEAAVKLAFTSKISIITGGPGVGKTTIIKAITDTLQASGYRPCLPSQEGDFHLCAFTGIAADRVSKATGCHSSTIHKLLMLDPQTDRFTYNSSNPLPSSILICDEASMISLGLMSALFDALPSDAHVVLVGDVDQLPPIDAGTPFKDLVEWGQIPTARLSKIHRQVENSLIIKGSQNIIRGEFPVFHDPKDPDVSKSDLFVFPYTRDEEALKLTAQLFMEKIPKTFHIRPDDIQIITPLKRRVGGASKDGDPPIRMLSAENINLVLQQALTGAVDKNRFNTHDRVVQTANDYRIGAECNGDPSIVVMNGEVGRIIAVYDRSGKFPKFEYDVEFRDGKRVHYNHERAMNLELAYALSVHKMQGQEAKAVIVLAYAFMSFHTRNMLYTAVTRGKQLVILVSPKGAADMRKILATPEIPRKSRIIWRVENDQTDHEQLEDIDTRELSGNL